MRRLALGVGLLVVATLTGAGVSYAQDPTAELKKLDALRMKGISDADMTAVGALLADDYVHVHAVGTVMNKQEYIDNLSKSPRKSYRTPDAKVSIRMYGEIAVMVGPQFNKAGDREPQQYTVTLIWRKMGGSWKQVGAAYSPIPAKKK
jgi:hypothetical protein